MRNNTYLNVRGENERLIKSFYLQEQVYLPSFAFQRQFKLRLPCGKVLLRKVSSSEKLQRILSNLTPVDVWYSVGRWANPDRVWPKRKRIGGYEFFDNLCYGLDVPFDIDGDYSLEGLEDARLRTLKVLEKVKQVLKVKYILFTGFKGFQIVCEEKDKIAPYIVIRGQNELLLRNKRKKYIELVSELINEPDKDVTIDPYRVIRLPGSARQTGWVATILPEQKLKMPIYRLVNHLKHYTPDRPRIPPRKMTKPRDYSFGKGTRSGLSVPFTFSVQNQIGKRTAIVLAYHEKQDWKSELELIRNVYGVENYVVVQQGERVWVVSPETFDVERAKKVYKASRAKNKTGMLRYGTSFWNFTLGKNLRLLAVGRNGGSARPLSAHLVQMLESLFSVKFQGGNWMKEKLRVRVVSHE